MFLNVQNFDKHSVDSGKTVDWFLSLLLLQRFLMNPIGAIEMPMDK